MGLSGFEACDAGHRNNSITLKCIAMCWEFLIENLLKKNEDAGCEEI